VGRTGWNDQNNTQLMYSLFKHDSPTYSQYIVVRRDAAYKL
jgi:hypothetical protein